MEARGNEVVETRIHGMTSRVLAKTQRPTAPWPATAFGTPSIESGGGPQLPPGAKVGVEGKHACAGIRMSIRHGGEGHARGEEGLRGPASRQELEEEQKIGKKFESEAVSGHSPGAGTGHGRRGRRGWWMCVCILLPPRGGRAGGAGGRGGGEDEVVLGKAEGNLSDQGPPYLRRLEDNRRGQGELLLDTHSFAFGLDRAATPSALRARRISLHDDTHSLVHRYITHS
ncbi:hypothetical protein B0H16DRAFT_97513 [Mycena metata]|uniref:Uncharacterized protein n=1 Tax=Mycena metata TaxID=1033252 RepID=A0AAD7MYR7_9AGAR|nr:hypothetical protein B0H16DRAFT_97513 [Mycena metata]